MKEKYEPSPSEIRKAENMMTDGQRKMSEDREDTLFEGIQQGKNLKKDDFEKTKSGHTDEGIKTETEIKLRVEKIKKQVKEQNIEQGDIVDVVFYDEWKNRNTPEENVKFRSLDADFLTYDHHRGGMALIAPCTVREINLKRRAK